MAIWVGTLVLLLGLLVFGVTALRHKPLPRWNALPLVAGIWFPAALLAGTITGGEFRNMDPLFAASVIGSALPLILLGYILQADTPREVVA